MAIEKEDKPRNYRTLRSIVHILIILIVVVFLIFIYSSITGTWKFDPIPYISMLLALYSISYVIMTDLEPKENDKILKSLEEKINKQNELILAMEKKLEKSSE